MNIVKSLIFYVLYFLIFVNEKDIIYGEWDGKKFRVEEK